MTSRRKPSAIQAAILNFLRRCATSSHSSPTFREIMSEIGASSTSVVSYHVTQLETKGYLSKSPKKFGSLKLTAQALTFLGQTEDRAAADNAMVEIPLCGVIQAGQPLAVLDGYQADESIFLDCSQLSRHSGDLFALRVRGDSMIDALVAEGDIIVLDQKSEVRNGDMVAAWLTEREELTLKYWYREGPRTRLQPANRTMGPIYVPAGEVVPQGKVMFVQRQLV